MIHTYNLSTWETESVGQMYVPKQATAAYWVPEEHVL